MWLIVIQLVFYWFKMSDVKVCQFCAKKSSDFAQMPNFYIHVKSHESVPSNCSICDKTFQSTIALNKHKKMFIVEKIFIVKHVISNLRQILI